MVFGLRKKKAEPTATESAVVADDANSLHAHNAEATETIGATGVDVGQSVDQLKKFKLLHKWCVHQSVSTSPS